MTLVVDASAVVAALVDTGRDGVWAEEMLLSDDLAAPHLMPSEVANILRKAALDGTISADIASIAFADLGALRVALFPFAPAADRVWELRGNLSAYDAWYVALSELLDAPLVTLDARLTRASGPRCTFRAPRDAS